jgi:hypothetical protein
MAGMNNKTESVGISRLDLAMAVALIFGIL